MSRSQSEPIANCVCTDIGKIDNAPMKTQIASDLHLESLPGGPGISMRRGADGGAVRVVERDGGCRLPAPEACVPVGDRDVLVLAGDIGTELMACEFVEQVPPTNPG